MMSVSAKQKDTINVKQYVTDSKGHKVAAIVDIKEFERIKDLIEDLSDLRAIEDRVAESVEDYEAYSRKRKSNYCSAETAPSAAISSATG
ncbi:MAG: hypothetical protein HZB37_01785 [Planctomycetes bacterium]|nr:hypothetical protein [Planctomycetota bacterium]